VQIGWVDYSRDERNKILNILRLLGTQGALDELGIGTVRDGFSNLLFPGISTLQTRAKYFVLLPYLFGDALKQKFIRPGDVRVWLEKQEVALVDTLIRNSPSGAEGIIGSRTYRQGRTVKMKPSAIYWSGLRTMGIFRYPEFSLDDACRETYLQSIKRREVSLKTEGEEGAKDDADALHDGHVLFSPIIPPNGYMKEAKIELTQEEAEYLFTHITSSKSTKGSLLGYMLAHHLMYPSFQEIEHRYLPGHLSDLVRQAQDFSRFIYGAHLMYNVIYSQDAAFSEEFIRWRQEVFRPIDIAAVSVITRCTPHTKTFLQNWQLLMMDYQQGRDQKAAKQLIIDREKFVKRDRAKLNKPEQYRYEVPVHNYMLSYRYATAHRIIKDIYDGLGMHYGQDFAESGK
jgi:hypothetical protein